MVTVEQTTVSYLGDYLAIVGTSFVLKANVDSTVASCRTGRAVTFTLDDGVGGLAPIIVTGATSGAGGAVSKAVDTSGWAPGEYYVLVEVAASSDGNCTAADNATSMDLVTVAPASAAATGGGWYFWKADGAGKRVNFGFTVSKQTDNT